MAKALVSSRNNPGRDDWVSDGITICSAYRTYQASGCDLNRRTISVTKRLQDVGIVNGYS